jgi:radical SAM family uncharacterized protein/radical SAM-linked protein
MEKKRTIPQNAPLVSPNIHRLEDSLIEVQKPARYIGSEVNVALKNPGKARLRMALCFPDVYEVGMSHLGLKILYHIINSQPELYAERAFAPWPDMEALLSSREAFLSTLETGTPLHELDFVGFSLQYELCATTVLQMLDLAGIPLRASQRSEHHPVVVGGGPVSFNPLPLSPFFDAFVIGDGEEAILALAESQLRWKKENTSKSDLLNLWKNIPGVYVPALHTPEDVVVRRIAGDLEKSPFPVKLVVPFCETVHDRVGLEIARGCTRGCRFCQAGMLNRPVREREPSTILNLAVSSIESTGWDEVALLSLSTGDYSQIEPLIASMADTFQPEKVAISLPSLRTDTFDVSMAEQIRKVRKTGFTLAPEAGTERLRSVINKGNTEQDLRAAVLRAFGAGWQTLKLYFMIGLPFETDDDLAGTAELIRKAAGWAQGRKITASVSTFVPKSHTPFQWCEQISPEETRRRQELIRNNLGKGRIKIKFHDIRQSFMEGVLARGDERLSNVIEAAFRKGARFDGWDEQLRFDIWMAAFEESGLDPRDFLGSRDMAQPLPWDFIHTGVSRDFLIKEWSKAETGEITGDCRKGECENCGVCDFESVYPRIAAVSTTGLEKGGETEKSLQEQHVRRFSLKYEKIGDMRFLGHHDVVRTFHRAFKRAQLELDYSKGFHPHPRLRFSLPLSLGIESLAEYVDFDLVRNDEDMNGILSRLSKSLPNGLNPVEIQETPLNEKPLSGKIQQVTYDINFSHIAYRKSAANNINDVMLLDSVEMSGIRKGRARTRNLKEWLERLDFIGETVFRIALRVGLEGSVNPYDAAEALLGVSKRDARLLRIVKTSVVFAHAQ